MNRVSQIASGALPRVIALIAITCAFYTPGLAQTAGGTEIKNQASATYSDGSGGTYETVSNTVIVTVANVSGLAITPDAGANGTVVPGQTAVLFSFRVTNTGNFADQVRFLASGASVYLSVGSPASITRAVIDDDSSNSINAGDIDIKTNAADVLSASIAQDDFIDVLVEVSVNIGATAGQSVQVFLGDAGGGSPFDNQASDGSAQEVRTVGASVNGLREARGDAIAGVVSDAQLALSLTGPAGPVALGSDITYVWNLCNTGARTATAVTLVNGPVGSNVGVFIIAPIPSGTSLADTPPNAFPAGTLYSISPLSQNPITTATWTTTAPVTLSDTTRVAFNVGPSLAATDCSANINMVVTITTSDATNPIVEQGDAYAKNSLDVQISAVSPVVTTTLLAVGGVLNGPQGQPGAVGPTDTNDDYTNKSVSVGIANVPPGGVTSAPSGAISFTNTVRNTGNANDNFTLTVTSFPAGSTVVVNGVTVVSAGVPTGNAVPPLAIAYGLSSDYSVAITLPAGKVVLTGYDTVIRATSGNTVGSTNDTIDRVYTGFVRLDKAATVANATGVGGLTDAVPGAVITFAITYTNVSSSGGTNNVTLTATNIVITENGAAAPNNWATYTDHVVGASDTLGGTITGDAIGSTLLTDTIASLAAGQSGVFTFKRQIQ